MKRLLQLNITTISLLMVVVFLLECTALYFSHTKATAIYYLLGLNIVITGVLFQQYRRSKIRRNEFIRYTNEQAENSLNATLDQMPIGVVRYASDTHVVEWFNPYADLMFKAADRWLDQSEIKHILQNFDKSSPNNQLTLANKRYAVRLDEDKHLLYFTDVTTEARVKRTLNDVRPVIGIVSVDNYDDATDLLSETEITQVNAFIASAMEAFSNRYRLFIRRISSNRYYLFADYQILARMIADKFDILKTFKAQSESQHTMLSLSLGIAYGNEDYFDIGRTALSNLELAMIRGGDQVVLKDSNERAKPRYFGGNTASRAGRTRTRARALSGALKNIMQDVDQVFVVGHKYPDMDAIGASVATKIMANIAGKEAFIVYDERQLLPDVKRAIQKLNEEDEGFAHVIKLETAIQKKMENSLLVMVDHSKVQQTLNEAFYQSFDKVVVIDHHRRDEGFASNAMLSYIESGASSASELVVEMLQYQGTGRKKMTDIEASIALAGISVDTKSFSKGTTSRTFEAAAYLRTQGANSQIMDQILATDFTVYKRVNALVIAASITDGVAIASGEQDQHYTNIETAKSADILLEMAGVNMAFSITNHQQGYVQVSARSMGDYNVERVMKAIGGGGHFNLAAAQIYEKTIQQVEEEIKGLIQTG